MRRIISLLLFLSSVGAGHAFAQRLSSETSSIIPWQMRSALDSLQPGMPKEYPQEFQFLALYYNHAVVSNVYSANPFTGEVVGRLFGSNSSRTGGPTAVYFEQRLLPFFIYQPKLFDGKAILRASFEIDWTWGDESYLAGGNRGGAFNADRVNIQTQNIELELVPSKGWAVNLGMQRLYDTPYNPYRTGASTLLSTGYRLAFWGSDAAGISVRRDWDFSRVKAGFYQLYERDPERNNDVVLWEAMAETDVTPTWRQGFSFWYVYDRANSQAGIATINEGLNSNLTGWMGTQFFSFPYSDLSDLNNRYAADIVWLGTFWSVNPEFTMGRWGMSGYAISNLGTVEYFDKDSWKKGADIFGHALNVRGGYKYGQTVDDAVTAEVLYTSGDTDGNADKKYEGVITGNMWGFPGSIYVGHGAYLLLPHGNVVNRYIAAIGDISNLGYGLTAVIVNAQTALVPNKLIAKIGGATAYSLIAPKGGKSDIGTEINAKVQYNFGPFMSAEFHTAYLALGDFYKSSLVNATPPPVPGSFISPKPHDPWTAFVSFRWLMF